VIRTGEQYRDSIRDGRRIWIDGERVPDVTRHPMFRPLVDIRARIYDMAHEDRFSPVMTYTDDHGETNAVALKLPVAQQDWSDKRRAVEAVMDDIAGVVTRVGDETVGEMWSLYDGQDVLNEADPRFAENIRNHVQRVIDRDPFHVSANTDPKGDRSKRPQEQDPDMLLHVVKETDAGIVVRGAKYETAAAYANQAFTKPTIANWGDAELSDYAVGFICELGSPNLKFICRTGFAGRAPAEDYPLSNRCDEIDALVVFDDVLIPWENVLFYRHTKAASFVRATLHRYSAFAFVLRILRTADLMVGTALFNARQTGLDKQQAVQEKLATLACYREGIEAHLTAAIAGAEEPSRVADAEPVAALFGARARLLATAPHDAHRARAVRRPDLRDAGRGGVPQSRNRAVAAEILHGERTLGGRGPAQAAGGGARPAQLRLRRPPADLPAVRAIAALCASRRGVAQLRLGSAAGDGAEGSGAVRPRASPAGPLRWPTRASASSTPAIPIRNSSSTTTCARR
jgi:4-hydroxyphenylacetate 3-monooxygenase